MVLGCPCAPGAGAVVASMRWHSRLLSARAVATRPTALCQDVPASQHQRQGDLVATMLSRPLGAAQSALPGGASLWAAECGMHVIWPCGGVRPREMRVEGRRRPWKPNVINKVRVVVTFIRSTRLRYTPLLRTQVGPAYTYRATRLDDAFFRSGTKIQRICRQG